MSTTAVVCKACAWKQIVEISLFLQLSDIRIETVQKDSTIKTSAVPTTFFPHKSRFASCEQAKSCHTCVATVQQQHKKCATRKEVKFDSMINSRQSMAKNENNKLHTRKMCNINSAIIALSAHFSDKFTFNSSNDKFTSSSHMSEMLTGTLYVQITTLFLISQFQQSSEAASNFPYETKHTQYTNSNNPAD